ncbi:MAG: hypothetical protein ABIP77_02985 [Candidatus Limnocylindrales bacterium]
MALRTIECSACGTAVPYGRLSCPECGQLLASVAGSARNLTTVAETVEDDDRAMPPAASEPVSMEADDMVEAEPIPTLEPESISIVAPEPVEAVESGSVAPEPPAWEPEPPAWEPQPGAYVPPAPTQLQPSAAELAGLAAPARAWGGIGSAVAEESESMAASGSDSIQESISLADPARRAEAIGWLAVAGAAVGAAGFLLPWARTIIGADGVGYLDTWGFAGPGHPLIVLGLLAVLGLAVVKNPIPAWARLGVPGLALGSLLIGMLWTYVLGPLGPLPGAYLSLVGACMLVAAAIASLASDRHASTHTGV